MSIVFENGEVKFSNQDSAGVLLPERADIRNLLPRRKRDSHKGTYGKAAIVAGSLKYTGAAYLSAAACLRSGVGYTSLFLPEGILPYYVLKLPEALLSPICKGECFVLEERFEKLLSYDSIAYGMGMGVSKEVAEGVTYLLRYYNGKLILDADGLNSLSAYKKSEFSELFKNKRCDVICTPHVKEFSRLTDCSVDEIQEDPFTICRAFSKKYKVNLYLKNALSLLCGEGRTLVIATGNSGQAKAGSGDVLSGLIAGLCASGLSAFDAGTVGGYLAGKAAELAVKDFGEYSLTATDLISYLGKAFLFVSENTDEGGR